MVADGPDALFRLIDGKGPAGVWDQMSHYVWLMPAGAVNRLQAERLMRAAWKRWSVIHVVVVTSRHAYTYDPFRDALRRQAVDAEALRAVARGKMNDLNGRAVRIGMFPTRLKAVKQPDGTYKGTDGIIASTLAKHMNFTPVYSEPSDGRKYGWAELNSDSISESHIDLLNPEASSESNYTYTGLLGDLVHNKVDMAFNGAFLKVLHTAYLIIIDRV